ncbi:MAG: low affinity iron permease family protein [Chloroflexota bacterium]|nr:MAG: low affinity iron permease family protein [Chloroflexota bacterium]
MNDIFHTFAETASHLLGSAWAFVAALMIIVFWAVTGPIFGFSDTWQLVINTGTTIITFLMVFLIQNTQNRDAKAIHLKLDELIRAVKGARTGLVDLEKMSEDELDSLEKEFHRLHERLHPEAVHGNSKAEDKSTTGKKQRARTRAERQTG